MSHVHKWYISRDYDGNLEGLCEDESCMAFLTEAQMVERINAVEQGLHADGALCKCENIESAIIRLMCKDCGLPLRPAGKA